MPRLSPFARCLFSSLAMLGAVAPLRAANPIITDVFTADPAALVYKGTVYLYTGHDEAADRATNYRMNEWLCFSSTDMVHWTAHGSPMSLKDFAWARSDAWAGQVIERNGKFYWYAPMHLKTSGYGIGVGVSDSPTGPFKDALGKPLTTSDMTPDPKNVTGATVTWDDIDPTVFLDDDGQAYLIWGNCKCYWAKLKANMTELDGAIGTFDGLTEYEEAPWVYKRNGKYYLAYAAGFPEHIAYAMADKITGPWKYIGPISEIAGNSNTIHPAIIDFQGQSYFIYHNGGVQRTGSSFRRSVCIDYLHYNADGTIQPVIMTTAGVKPAGDAAAK